MVTSGYCGAISCAICLHRRLEASTLALSTTVKCLRRFIAYSKPTFKIRSISGRVYIFVSYALSLSWYFSPKYIPPVNSRIHRKSAPSTNSARRGDLCTKHLNVWTGRILANKPSFLRIASSPCSGRTLAVGSLSNLGSPTAEKRTASAFLQTR